MKCTNCKFCITNDYGYSNYTVEGTSADCLFNLNPKFPVDRFYDLEPSLGFAKECPSYAAEESVHVDCDQELGDLENYSDDPEVKELLKAQ